MWRSELVSISILGKNFLFIMSTNPPECKKHELQTTGYPYRILTKYLMQSELSYPFIYFNKMFFLLLSKTTKLILLDSLLQEVCISSVFDGSLTLSSLGLSVCLSQSQTSLFRAKESLLNNEISKK